MFLGVVDDRGDMITQSQTLERNLESHPKNIKQAVRVQPDRKTRKCAHHAQMQNVPKCQTVVATQHTHGINSVHLVLTVHHGKVPHPSQVYFTTGCLELRAQSHRIHHGKSRRGEEQEREPVCLGFIRGRPYSITTISSTVDCKVGGECKK